MENVGWFNPEGGYWETEGEPAQKYIDAYPEGTYKTEGTKPTGDHEWDHENKEWVYVTPIITSSQINFERDSRIRKGTVITLGEDEFLVVEGDETSKLNLTNLGLAAQGRMAAGDNTPFLYRDGLNETHSLTPAQMHDVWKVSIQHVEDIYAASWALKAMDPTPLDYADDQYWP